jgi:hypothetical protein
MILVWSKWMNVTTWTRFACNSGVPRQSNKRPFSSATHLFADPRLWCEQLWLQMGRVRARERRAGIRRDGPAGRAERGEHNAGDVDDVARERQRERARDRQRESRRRRREAANSGIANGSLPAADLAGDDGVNRRLVRRDVGEILACVERSLGRQRRSRLHKRVVMRTVWESPLIRDLLPPEAQPVPAEVHAREGIVSSLCQSLSEVKTSRTRAQLVTKHAILTTVITNGS